MIQVFKFADAWYGFNKLESYQRLAFCVIRAKIDDITSVSIKFMCAGESSDFSVIVPTYQAQTDCEIFMREVERLADGFWDYYVYTCGHGLSPRVICNTHSISSIGLLATLLILR